VLDESVLPKWAARCSAACVTSFNETVGKTVGLTARK
ncbi:transporter, partial [Stenotrophomonas maltophilia]